MSTPKKNADAGYSLMSRMVRAVAAEQETATKRLHAEWQKNAIDTKQYFELLRRLYPPAPVAAWTAGYAPSRTQAPVVIEDAANSETVAPKSSDLVIAEELIRGTAVFHPTLEDVDDHYNMARCVWAIAKYLVERDGLDES